MAERIDPIRGDVFFASSGRVQPKNRKKGYRDGRRSFEQTLEKHRRSDDDEGDGLDAFA